MQTLNSLIGNLLAIGLVGFFLTMLGLVRIQAGAKYAEGMTLIGFASWAFSLGGMVLVYFVVR